MRKQRKRRYCICLILGFLFAFFLEILPATGSVGFQPSVKQHYAQSSLMSLGQTYYVSTLGDDTNPGTSPEQAWKTTNRVNSETFHPGDQILFQGGQSFEGGLLFDSNDLGTSEKPVLVSSYGEGRAAIYAHEENGLFAHNTSGFKVSNINFSTFGLGNNQGSGINFFNDLPDNVQLDYIIIEYVDVSRFGETGILIGGWNQKSGYRNVAIQHVTTHDNGEHGLNTYAEEPNTHQNVYVAYVEAFNNFGSPGKIQPTGNGIILGGVSHGKIEYSLAYNNGSLNDSASGPAGIWTYDSSHIVIQYNESHHNQTGGQVDGDGFDLDQNVSHSVLQYNYSHDNEGAGYLLSHGVDNFSHTQNIVRYNVSYNDGLRNNYAGILLYGRINSSVIHNNTVIADKAIEGNSLAFKTVNYGIEDLKISKLLVCNNHFESENSRLIEIAEQQLSSPASILLIRNNYYTADRSPEIQWGNELFTNLQQWRRVTAQELFESQPMERNVDPEFIETGNESIPEIRLGEISNQQNLSADSQLIDQGADLGELFGINPGQNDFYGTPIPQGHQYDIGAYEWKGS